MNLLTREDLRALMEKQGKSCVSIYMLTHRTAPDSKQDSIRFKNLLREAEERLTTKGLGLAEMRRLLKPGRSLLKDNLFWQYQGDGLAAFISTDFFRSYCLPVTLPELLVVTDRFHIKPIVQLLTNDGRFYVLALSQNEVRLLQCTRYGWNEVDLKNVPRNLAEALSYDDPEKQLQYHTGTPRGLGQRAAMFHGQGAGAEDTKVNILRYFQQMDQGLQNLLRDEKAPVVLAGVEFLFPIYREANTFLNLMEKGIKGNPEGTKPEDLHRQAWEIVRTHFLKTQQEAAEQYGQSVGSERASKDLTEIVRAAYDGRVDLLFVPVGVQRWGTFDPSTRDLHLHELAELGDEDLLDLAALHTLLNSGTVFAVSPEEVPGEGPVAALFRY